MRDERPGDRAFLRALYGEHRRAELAGVTWPAAAKARFLDDQFALQCAHYAALPAVERRVLTRGMRAIGRMYLDRTAPLWSLAEIGLVAAERGHGLGAALIGWLQDAAAAAGAEGVKLQVTRDNPRAAAFYARAGFRLVDLSSPTRLRMEWRR